MDEIKKLIDDLNQKFAAFKEANDLALKERATKGAVDTLVEEKVGKLNAAVDEAQKKVDAAVKSLTERADDIEKKLNRPGGTGGEGDKVAAEVKSFNLTNRIQAQLKGRPVPAELGAEEYVAYKAAFVEWARRGADYVSDVERKTLSVGSDPDGGYLVPASMAGRIVQRVFETSDVRAIAAVQSISTDALEGPNDLNEANAGWVSEAGARTASSTPSIGEWRIPVHEMYAMPEATQKLLDDAQVDVEAWLGNKIADKLVRIENAAFVTGNGVGKPRGFASYTTAATADGSRSWGTLEHVATGTSASFGTDPNGSDILIDLAHKLKKAYRNGATWAMNKGTVGAVRKLKDSAGYYIWLPSMTAQQPATLLGYPVAELEDMADYTTASALAIAFGNFREGYQIVDRQGIRTLRDPFTNKPYVRFYTTRRVGGDVLNFEAIKFLKFAAS